MLTRRATIRLVAGCLAIAPSFGATAQAPAALKTVATFSILADMVANVGGDRVEITTLVGPDGDAHVYAPTPADARRVNEAKLVVTNGLKFEGWINRLLKSSGSKALTIEAAGTVKGLKSEDDPGRAHAHAHDDVDPHAWQSVGNAKLYVAAIRDGLTAADPAGKAAYEANATAYLARLDALEADIKALVASIPKERRRIITSHDAFRYFEAAYGVEFVAPQGVSTDAEASAKDVAKIIQQIRRDKIAAVFVENVSDPRLMQRIASETGAKLGSRVYSDALSGRDGPAATYIDMMRHNIKAFSAALSS
jgi:zinc/manganese transport system substrate-binding protein